MAIKKQIVEIRTCVSRSLFMIKIRASEVLGDKASGESLDKLTAAALDAIGRGAQDIRNSLRLRASKAVAYDGEKELTKRPLHESISYVDFLRIGILVEPVPDYEPSDLFAAIALKMIDAISEDFQYPMGLHGFLKLPNALEVVSLADFGIEAMDAVCEAEKLQNDKKRDTDISINRDSINRHIAIHLSERAKRGADVAHIENREIKAQAFSWCDVNMTIGKTIDEGAVGLENIVPVKLSTRRTYVLQWRKKQSTSKLTSAVVD